MSINLNDIVKTDIPYTPSKISTKYSTCPDCKRKGAYYRSGKEGGGITCRYSDCDFWFWDEDYSPYDIAHFKRWLEANPKFLAIYFEREEKRKNDEIGLDITQQE